MFDPRIVVEVLEKKIIERGQQLKLLPKTSADAQQLSFEILSLSLDHEVAIEVVRRCEEIQAKRDAGLPK